jgi:hypothetical protein
MPTHSYIFTPSREMWPAASVNARIPPVSDNGAKPVSARPRRTAADFHRCSRRDSAGRAIEISKPNLENRFSLANLNRGRACIVDSINQFAAVTRIDMEA